MNMEKMESPDKQGKSKKLKTQIIFSSSFKKGEDGSMIESFIDNEKKLEIAPDLTSESYVSPLNFSFIKIIH